MNEGVGPTYFRSIYENRSGPVWILECEVFDDAGEVVRRVVISDGLDQICTNLNGVARFFVG